MAEGLPPFFRRGESHLGYSYRREQLAWACVAIAAVALALLVLGALA